MTYATNSRTRSGALAVEAALVYPVMIALILLTIVGGMGVFRYQQVACQAREVARWVAVRGGDYQRTTDLPSPTEQEIRKQIVEPLTAGMSLENLSVQIQWIERGSGQIYQWDGNTPEVQSVNAAGEYVTNTVRVTVTYQWSPEVFRIGPLTLQSTCEIPMSN